MAAWPSIAVLGVSLCGKARKSEEEEEEEGMKKKQKCVFKHALFEDCRNIMFCVIWDFV